MICLGLCSIAAQGSSVEGTDAHHLNALPSSTSTSDGGEIKLDAASRAALLEKQNTIKRCIREVGGVQDWLLAEEKSASKRLRDANIADGVASRSTV